MNYTVEFKCKGESPEEIPVSIIHSAGVSFYAAHTESNAMAAIAAGKQALERDCVCKVPFCLTVEAEAFGANVIIADDKTGPRFDGYRFTSLEQLTDITAIDLQKGRISEVLHCIEILRERGNIVTLNVEGPFTILGMLMDSFLLFKGINKGRQTMEQTLRVIEDNVVKYILAALEKGAQIISYADPTGALEIVGPKIYRELSGRISYNILKRVEGNLNGAIMHLCGKTSTALEKNGFCRTKPVEVPPGLTYGQSIAHLLLGQDIKFLGHNCMKSSPACMQSPVVWQVELM